MARIGELLVDAGILEADKLEQALRAQIVWGGRLGTNLIELGFIDLDELSRALGRQHGLPAALARHFERADPELQKKLPAELADRYSFVPLLRLADDQIALAGMDPLGAKALAEIAAALRCTPDQLVTSIAAEQRMRYQLERVYGIARGARYLRSRGGTIPPFPTFGDFDTEADSDVDMDVPVEQDLDIPIEWDEEPDLAVPRADAEAMTTLLDDAVTQAEIDDAVTEMRPRHDTAGRERRAYVRTLADAEPSMPPKARPPAREEAADKKALGRIAIRRVKVAPGGATDDATRTETLADAARAIRRGPHRDRVAELVVYALERFAPNCLGAVMLIVRGTTASGWKHFCRSGATCPELAVPLDEPGLVPQAIERGATVRASADMLGAIDTRLLRALDRTDGELAVIPVAIAGRVLCVIAAALDTDAAISNLETVATSAGTAFARLMRDASR